MHPRLHGFQLKPDALLLSIGFSALDELVNYLQLAGLDFLLFDREAIFAVNLLHR
jgi:hypothetical protein